MKTKIIKTLLSIDLITLLLKCLKKKKKKENKNKNKNKQKFKKIKKYSEFKSILYHEMISDNRN
jgi:hypothetical protein